MSTELAVPQEIVGSVAKYADQNTFKNLSGTGGFLPYVMLMSSNSAKVKEGAFPMGHFALSKGKDSLEDIGNAFSCVVISWRPKAMQYAPEVMSVFNPENSVFKDIQNRADNVPNSGCGYGPEFLIWLPEQETLATMFLGNPTGRQEAPNFLTFLGKLATINSHLIKTKKFSWHGPQIGRCNVEFQLPDWNGLTDQIQKFNNPPDTETEVAEETSERER